MMGKQGDKHILICDFCGRTSDEVFDTYQEAVDNERKIGWVVTRLRRGDWGDLCPECREDV